MTTRPSGQSLATPGPAAKVARYAHKVLAGDSLS
jgi:hypothetical protein